MSLLSSFLVEKQRIQKWQRIFFCFLFFSSLFAIRSFTEANVVGVNLSLYQLSKAKALLKKEGEMMKKIKKQFSFLLMMETVTCRAPLRRVSSFEHFFFFFNSNLLAPFSPIHGVQVMM